MDEAFFWTWNAISTKMCISTLTLLSSFFLIFHLNIFFLVLLVLRFSGSVRNARVFKPTIKNQFRPVDSGNIYLFTLQRAYLQFEIVFFCCCWRMNCLSPRKNLNLADTDEWSEWIGEISIHLFCRDYHYYEWWKLLWNSWKDAKLCKLSSYLRMVRTFFSDFRSSFKCC